MSAAHRAAMAERLVDGAARCAAAGDLDAVTSRAVVAEAGVSTGTLYHHFASVEHVLAALAERELRQAIARASAAPTAPGEGPLAWTLRHLVGDAALAARLAGLRRRVEAGRAGPDAAARLDAMVRATLGEVVRQARVEGEVAADVDADALVALLAMVWDGLGRPGAPEPGAVVDVVSRLVAPGRTRSSSHRGGEA